MRKRIYVSLMAASIVVSLAAVSPAAFARCVDIARAYVPLDVYVGDHVSSAKMQAARDYAEQAEAVNVEAR